MSYNDFLLEKQFIVDSEVINVELDSFNPVLFDFQKELTKWALRKGRACIFAGTGLGKTYMQLDWARLTKKRTIIIAPLLVASQTIEIGKSLGINVEYYGGTSDIQITNYEQIHNIDVSKFEAVVLDESSILKGLNGKTRKRLNDIFKGYMLKLCCTATPAPNDVIEIINHIEFLGYMTAMEARSMFFVNDASDVQKWRLKGHAKESFYKWLASWAIILENPKDLDFITKGFVLPKLNINPVFIPFKRESNTGPFFRRLKGIQDRSKVRKQTMQDRIDKTVEIIKKDTGNSQWIVWCGLNEEGRILHKSLKGSELMEGSQKPEKKIELAKNFVNGTTKILITKPKMMQFGMNLQNCHNMVFNGLSDSWESYYQSIRRCWRFGQKHEVNVNIVLSTVEKQIYANVMKKEKQAEVMKRELLEIIKQYEQHELKGILMEEEYKEDIYEDENVTLMLGDSCDRMKELDEKSIDLSIFSPPFQSLYTYTPFERDLGNTKDEKEFFKHFKYVIDELLRVTKNGRLACVHVSQVAAMLVRDGYIGMKDFRGKTIQAFMDSGFIYHGEFAINKNPQVQAIRTHAKGLLFAQMKKDGAALRPANGDYVLIFRKDGENEVPVLPAKNGVSPEDWIEWAHPVWNDIKETNTLNTKEARDKKDERHICPLQLDVISRLIRLYSNKGETICTPFMGIGSEMYQAIIHSRKGIGIELKESYYKTAIKNCKKAITKSEKVGFFK